VCGFQKNLLYTSFKQAASRDTYKPYVVVPIGFVAAIEY
jgi:hypothetical protein